jgi:hypothetical protein
MQTIKQNKSRRLLSLLLTAAMALGLLTIAPLTANAAAPDPSPTDTWDFFIVNANGSGKYGGGSWFWTQSSRTLTLTNIRYSTSSPVALQLPDDATIVLNGTNTITSTYSSAGSPEGILALGNLTITGSGSLTADASAGTGTVGIYTHNKGSLTINGGTVTAIGSISIYPNYTVPNGYKYWKNTIRTDPGGAGTVSDGTGNSDNTRFFKVECVSTPGYSVTYNLSFGSGTIPTEPNHTAGQTFAAASAAGLSYSGLAFKEWNTRNDGTGTSYAQGAIVTMPAANLTLYAIWLDNVTFTAEQAGGTSGTADSTGIHITFSKQVAGLKAGDITITNGTGAVTKGALTLLPGSVTAYTIALTSVEAQGTVQVSVADFGAYHVSTGAQTVTVYKNTGGAPAMTAAITGVTPPVAGAAPVTAVTETEQYTGVVTWSPAVSSAFAAGTAYTATITLTAKAGYTFADVTANFFTVAGAASVANAAGSGVVTVVFPVTGALTITGPVTMALAAGYAATSTGVYTISGTPIPTVSKESGNAAIVWNGSAMKLEIAAGLAAGTYPVVLKASNGADPDATLTFTLTVTASGAEPFPFTDVKISDWFYNDVKTAWETGLINGKTTTTFAPNDNMTYVEAIKLAACMHQLYTTGKVTLTNSPTGAWYDSYIEYAKNNDIIDRNYMWSAQVPRSFYMFIFAHALPDSALPGINIVLDGAIPDVPMTNPQAAEIYKLYRAGIVQGVDTVTHSCNPGSNIKRSEVAAILTRMMDGGARVFFSM